MTMPYVITPETLLVVSHQAGVVITPFGGAMSLAITAVPLGSITDWPIDDESANAVSFDFLFPPHFEDEGGEGDGEDVDTAGV